MADLLSTEDSASKTSAPTNRSHLPAEVYSVSAHLSGQGALQRALGGAHQLLPCRPSRPLHDS